MYVGTCVSVCVHGVCVCAYIAAATFDTECMWH